MAVDMTEFNRLGERAQACWDELNAVEREFRDLIARWNAGTSEERATAQQTVANWDAANARLDREWEDDDANEFTFL